VLCGVVYPVERWPLGALRLMALPLNCSTCGGAIYNAAGYVTARRGKRTLRLWLCVPCWDNRKPVFQATSSGRVVAVQYEPAPPKSEFSFAATVGPLERGHSMPYEVEL
jgi:hypothetical protein